MKDLLADGVETVMLTATVQLDGAWHGPNSTVTVSPEKAAELLGAGQAKAANAAKPNPAEPVKHDLANPLVRIAVKGFMAELPKDADHFTNGGMPEIKAVIAAAAAAGMEGLTLTAATRDELWAETQVDLAAAEGGAAGNAE